MLIRYMYNIGLIHGVDLFQSMPKGTNGALQIGSIRNIETKALNVRENEDEGEDHVRLERR